VVVGSLYTTFNIEYRKGIPQLSVQELSSTRAGSGTSSIPKFCLDRRHEFFPLTGALKAYTQSIKQPEISFLSKEVDLLICGRE
jgi:hypothetical protein